MSEPKKKKSLSTLHQRIKAIRQRRPSDAKVEEMNMVIEQGEEKGKQRIARSPEVEG